MHDLLAELEILEEIAGDGLVDLLALHVVHVGVADLNPMMEAMSVTRQIMRSAVTGSL
jgi:hypothetical protein